MRHFNEVFSIVNESFARFINEFLTMSSNLSHENLKFKSNPSLYDQPTWTDNPSNSPTTSTFFSSEIKKDRKKGEIERERERLRKYFLMKTNTIHAKFQTNSNKLTKLPPRKDIPLVVCSDQHFQKDITEKHRSRT